MSIYEWFLRITGCTVYGFLLLVFLFLTYAGIHNQDAYMAVLSFLDAASIAFILGCEFELWDWF